MDNRPATKAAQRQSPIKGLELLARQLVEGFITGLHKSPFHGFSVEFAEHRLYNPGQSTRHLDWKVYARTDRLYTRQYAEETNLRCLLMIDASSSMFYPKESKAKIEFSVNAAAAIGWLLHKQRDAVGLCVFDDQIRMLTPLKSSKSGLDKIFNFLEQLTENSDQPHRTDTAGIIHEVAEKIHRRSLVVLFTDMLDAEADAEPIFNALQHLKHNHHEILLFHVYDGKTEHEFQFENRPHEFIDNETGEKIKLNPAEIRTTFLSEQESRHKAIEAKCHQLKIDLIDADVNKGYLPVLQAYLIKRARMN